MKKHLCALLTAAAMLLHFAPTSTFAADDLSISVASVSAELKAGETVSVPVRADANSGYAFGYIDAVWDNTALTLKSIEYTDLAQDNGSAAISDKGSCRIMFGSYTAAENISGTGVLFTLEFEITAAAIAGDYTIVLEDAKIRDKDAKEIPTSLQSGVITLTGEALKDAFTMSAAKTEVTFGETDDILVPITAEHNPGFVSGRVDVIWNADALTLKAVEFTDLAPNNGSAEILSNGSYRVMIGSYTAAKNNTGTGTLFTLIFTPKSNLPVGEYSVMLANPSLLNYNVQKVPVTVQAGAVIVKEQATNTTTSAAKLTETTTTTTSTTKPTETTTTTTSTTKPTETTTTTTSTTKPTETTTTTTSTTKPTDTTTTTTSTTKPTETTTTTTSTTKPTETTTTSTTEPLISLKGDYNADGEVSVADAVLLVRFLAEDTTLSDNQIDDILNADPDYDNDCLVTILDVAALLKKLGDT